MPGQKILVTGSTGFIGRRLVKLLVNRGEQVTCLVRKDSQRDLFSQQDVKVVIGNVFDQKSLDAASKNIDLIFHLVGVGSLTDNSPAAYRQYYLVNAIGTRNLLRAAASNRARGVIYFSSLAAQGLITDQIVTESSSPQPKSAYEKSKLLAESEIYKFRKTSRLPVAIIRPAMVYGPGASSSELHLLAKIIKTGVCPVIGTGQNMMPMIFVDDLVRAVSFFVNNKVRNESYLMTRASGITYLELLENIKAAVAVKCLFVYFPVGVAWMAAGVLELLGALQKKSPLMNRLRIRSLTSNREFDMSKAVRELNYSDTDFFSSIYQTLNSHD
jgi:nucleoside-diphosphate-sugar epimerase